MEEAKDQASEAQDLLTSIFYPDHPEQLEQLKRGEIKFAQYTSAEAAASFISNGQAWLRNSLCMNDYSEIQHGLDCLIAAYHKKDDPRNKLKLLLNDIFPGLPKKLEDRFNEWIPYFKTDTYITCLSEHPSAEDKYGRLSMWRAYGGDQPVAVVLNTEVFTSETDLLHANIYPVSYLSPTKFNEKFFSISDRIEKHRDLIAGRHEDEIFSIVFELFRSYAVSIKHPGFAEEREWRVVYMPTFRASEHVKMEMETINGVPQEICKIPLKEFPEEGFIGASIPRLISRIIIGPNEDEIILQKSFIKLLENAGCNDACNMVHVSGIPLRT